MSTRLSAAEWRNRTEQDLNDLQRRTNTLQERHVDPDELESIAGRLNAKFEEQQAAAPRAAHELLKRAGEQRARGENVISNRLEEGLGVAHMRMDELDYALHAAREGIDQIRDPEQLKALIATVMQGSAMNGVDPVVGLKNAADRGIFDNVWRFSEDWRPLARPIDTLKNAPLGGAIRAMAENVGVRPSAALKAERIAAATLAGTAGSMTALAALDALSSPEAGVTVYNA